MAGWALWDTELPVGMTAGGVGWVGSFLAIVKQKTFFAGSLLAAVVLLQTLGYGMLFNVIFLLRSMSLIGGILMLMADANVEKKRRFFAGLPELSEKNKTMYISLIGRILLILLFVTVLLEGSFDLPHLIFAGLVLLACAMIVVGKFARYSASYLLLVLTVMNFIVNDFWNYENEQEDFVRYDFFQTLSVIGGYMMLLSVGPGSISYFHYIAMTRRKMSKNYTKKKS